MSKAQTIWTWESRTNGFPHVGALWLAPVLWSQEAFDEYEDPAEAIREYLSMILTDYPGAREVPLYWQVAALGERAPFQPHDGEVDGMRIMNGSFAGDDFLHHFTWPTAQTTGERADWYGLPVKAERCSWMWTALGWLPLALQRTVTVDVLHLLARRVRTTTGSADEPMATEKQIAYLTSLLRKAGSEADADEIRGLSKAEAHRRISALVDQANA
ncbi:DUF3072 domain-containing protein [Streptomyces sp. NPDC002225]|uniref:DUF3072 domain-containing protein n=1 Tax=Streptomyces sp. NPDC002225 TaxID=3154413 RepID=UPI003332A53A